MIQHAGRAIGSCVTISIAILWDIVFAFQYYSRITFMYNTKEVSLNITLLLNVRYFSYSIIRKIELYDSVRNVLVGGGGFKKKN